MIDRLLDPKDAAEILNCSPWTLKDWRLKKRYWEYLEPLFVRIGSRWKCRESVARELAAHGFPR
jgi:hypothetical protein